MPRRMVVGAAAGVGFLAVAAGIPALSSTSDSSDVDVTVQATIAAETQVPSSIGDTTPSPIGDAESLLNCPDGARSGVIGTVAPGAEGYPSPAEAAAKAPANLMNRPDLAVVPTDDPLQFTAVASGGQVPEGIVHIEPFGDDRWIATSVETCGGFDFNRGLPVITKDDL